MEFLPFKPGLVDLACVRIDPYYLTHEAQSIGYDPKVILAGEGSMTAWRKICC